MPKMKPRSARSTSNGTHPVDKKSIDYRFGCRLRNLRLEREMTQAGMAAAFSMDRSFLSDCERGMYSLRLAMIEAIAAGFKISLSDLFKGL